MQFRYPDPDILSDKSIREALASNGIEGFPFLDADGKSVPRAKRVEAFREFLRIEREKEARNATEA